MTVALTRASDRSASISFLTLSRYSLRSSALLATSISLQALLTVADSFEPFLPPDFYKAALAVVVVVNAVLRIYTTQPVCLRGGE